GGRRLGPFVAAVSASASSSSAWTLLGVSGAAYAWGLSALWLFPACVGGFCLNWYVLAPSLQRLSHRTGALTVTDVLAGHGANRNAAVTWLASLIVIVSLGAYVAYQYQGAGKTFHATFDIPLWESILIGAGIVLLYTILGGFWAVSLTDTLQGLVMALTAVILPIAGLVEVGGIAGLAAGLRAVEIEGYLSLGGPRPLIVAVGFVAGLLGIGLGYPGQPHVVNRFMALRNDPGAIVQARRVAVTWAVLVYAGMLLVGLCGRVLLPDLADKEGVFISLTNDLFPPVAAGVMLAAVLSAIMSTADSQLLVAASTVTNDLGLGGRSPATLLRRSRLAVLGVGFVAVFAALFDKKEIFSRVLFAWTAMGAAFGPLLIVIVVLRRRLAPRHVFAAMAAGFAVSVVTFYVEIDARFTLAFQYVLPFVVSTAIAWTLSRPPAQEEVA
ncbi:MAG: sodium/proline symporter, partial [Planctomycetota bacterium]